MLEAAGRVSTAVFCARGTLLLGEPELSTIDTLSSLAQDEVLALVAGAEQYGAHPVAVAIQRAARAHNIQADAIRSPHYQPGLGVTAVASHGKPLVVGSRGLMLKERISVARAEARITELEASGRTVLLVALDNHLVGLLSLQDGLRAGARAAVQHLLDVGIEPVLLSGDSRETCASLGRTIDIDHIRPDVLPADRGREVERLRSGGANVAVVGRSPTDDVALGAASVSVALPGLGNNNSDFDIELGNDEVQKAALALRIAHQLSKATLKAVTVMLVGASLALLCLLALGMPAGWLPVAYLGISLFAALPLLTASAPGEPAP
jgi:P-type E1-E2 ATPase